MAEAADVERLLRSALAPVEPPERLADRLESTLSELTGAAAEELADWELGAMRDPRNWARPVAALVVGGVAGGALVVVRARHHRRRRGGIGFLERAVKDVTGDVRRRLTR